MFDRQFLNQLTSRRKFDGYLYNARCGVHQLMSLFSNQFLSLLAAKSASHNS